MMELKTASPLRTGERDAFASAADYAYATIRRAIVEGRFAPARRMREIELADWLGISRTPLRQALTRLELDGLLENRPRAGLVVSSLDERAIFELYETREALEGSAAAMAARHSTARDVETLWRLMEGFRSDTLSAAELYHANRTFHEAIYASAHNRFLVKSLQSLHDAMALLGPTTLAAPGRRQQAALEHEDIVRAIEARDADGAEMLARAHVRNGLPLRKSMRPETV